MPTLRRITLADIRADHPEAKRAGRGWLIRCPVHADNNPSLSIAEDEGGRLLVHCHAGCAQEDVLGALGIARSGAARVNHSGERPGDGQHSPVMDRSTAGLKHESKEPVRVPKWHWSTLAIAQAAFGRLAPVKNDRVAREFLGKYGLDPDLLPEGDWCVFDHPTLGAGIAYRGYDAHGNLVFKFKGYRRNESGKRSCVFLFGSGGALVFSGPENATLVLVGGEEKGAAAAQAGFRALAFLTGERCPDEDWLQLIVEQAPSRIILANDHDDPGRKADLDTAQALERTGYPAERISLLAWPPGVPAGFDLNDVAQAGGPAAVCKLLKSARPYESNLPRCLSAENFITADRPPLAFHIEGLLPYGGKLTLSATSKFGKSMLAIQTGFALGGRPLPMAGLEIRPPGTGALLAGRDYGRTAWGPLAMAP